MENISLFTTLAVSALLLPAADAAAQTVGGQSTLVQFQAGSAAFEEFGNACCGTGDLDGDGVPDYVIASVGHDSDRGLVTAHSGDTGFTLWTREGESTNDHFGHALVALGDVSGDGVPDLAVSAPYNDSRVHNGGEIYLLSGADGSVLWDRASPTEDRHLGTALGAADIDGDGHLDVIAGMPEADNGATSESGKISAYEGQAGSFLGDYYGVTENARLGWSVAGVGDVNGDGFEDVAVGIPGRTVSGLTSAGRVTILSGREIDEPATSGSGVLARIDGGQTGEEFGWSVVSMGDLNGDGYEEILAGAPYYDDALGNTNVGRARLFNGADRAQLAEFVDSDPVDDQHFGRTVARGGDVDHDGQADFLIAAPAREAATGNHVGAVYAFSGASYDLIFSQVATRWGSLMGSGLANIGDLDGDGTDEFVSGSPGSSSLGMTSAGVAHVWGLDPFLNLDELSANPGDVRTLDIDFPVTGGQYKILISLDGPGPTTYGSVQVPLGILYLPLNSSAYPSFTSGFYGTLDSEGRASASLTVPSVGAPIDVYLAAVQSDLGTAIDRSSIVQVLRIEP